MKITNLLFWVQENTISAKFYKKLGFEVVCSDDHVTRVALQGFAIDLLNMRDEDKFAKDALSGDCSHGNRQSAYCL